MNNRLRRWGLIGHVLFSVGWFGAALAYLPLSIFVLLYENDQMIQGVYTSLNVIGWIVIVPCSIGAFITGIFQSAISPWGLLRHYWVVAKLVLTVFGIAILVMHMPTVAESLNFPGAGQTAARMFQKQLVIHAAGGVLLLSVITAISVLKPWGIIWPERDTAAMSLAWFASAKAKRWALLLVILAVALVIILHLAEGHFLQH